MPKHPKLPYFESLGTLLEDLGMSKHFIIGDQKGQEGINWIEVRARDLDVEITTHAGKEVPLIKYQWRPDGTKIFDCPLGTAKDGVKFSFLEAVFREKRIYVTCNVIIRTLCEVKEFTVQDLRNRLDMAKPSWLRQLLYSQ